MSRPPATPQLDFTMVLQPASITYWFFFDDFNIVFAPAIVLLFYIALLG